MKYLNKHKHSTFFDLGGTVVYGVLGLVTILSLIVMKYGFKKKWDKALEEKIELSVFIVFICVLVTFTFLRS